MEYAVVDFNGKQYKVSPGLKLDLEGVGKIGENMNFERVLLMVNNGEPKIGTPTVSGAVVSAKILGNKRGEKIRVSKFKAKSKYRKTVGFRQSLISVEIQPFSFQKTTKSSPKK